MDPKQNLEPI